MTSPRPFDEQAAMTPLRPGDPPKVGDFWLDARLTAAASGIAYVAHERPDEPVMLVLLSEGAASDAAARERFAGAVNQLHIDTVVARGGHGQDSGRLGHRYRAEDDDPAMPGEAPLAPWVALAYDGSPDAAAEARRLLAEVDLSWLPEQGRTAGPDYEHYWIEQAAPGRWRLWPLPWPGRPDRSGWLSILASWILMLLLMCLAVLIAILLFQNAPRTSPPPPVPTSGSGSPPPSQSSSPSPNSASASPSSASASASPSSASPSSASPSSASPSSASASPSESPSPTPSDSPSSASPSPTPSGSPSAGSPTPNSRL